MNREELQDFIDWIFAEQAIAIGGAVAGRPVDDDVIWRLVRTLDSIRLRALARALYPTAHLRLEQRAKDEAHPAIRTFLKKLSRVRA